MEILIKGECPNCRERILFHHIFKDEMYSIENKEVKDLTFNLLCNASKEAYKASIKKEFFENILNKHFKAYEERIINANNKKELLNLKREMSKTKIRISKDLKDRFHKIKHKLLDSIIAKDTNNRKSI